MHKSGKFTAPVTFQVIQKLSESCRARENSHDLRRRLRQDLLNRWAISKIVIRRRATTTTQCVLPRERDRAVEKQIHPLFLQFRDQTKEKTYRAHKGAFPGASTMGYPVAALVIAISHLTILPW